MDKSDKNPHAGHRKRVREKFLKEQIFDGYPDHNILEMLLFHSIPRADTNELAHRLIDTFGSLNGVFDAPYSALTSVDGVGEQTAVLLKLVPALVKKYLEGNVSGKKYINTTEDAVEYIRPHFATLKKEELMMVCMNNSGKILKAITISKGGSDFTEVDTRKIVQEVIMNHATQIILAHNHPGGICAPSKADVMITNNIANLMRSINARLANHIIVTDNDYFSFASTPKYAALFIAEPKTNEECDNTYEKEDEI